MRTPDRTPVQEDRMDIGPPRRIIEVEPVTVPLPVELPDPIPEPVPVPADPSPADPAR